MSRSRAGSLGLRLSRWLALQSLFGLSAVCAAVYAATALSFDHRQAETLRQKEALVLHLFAEARQQPDLEVLRHKLADFSVGQAGLSIRLLQADGSVFYEGGPPAAALGDGAKALRFDIAAAGGLAAPLTGRLALDTREDAQLLRQLGLTLLGAALAGTALVSAGGFLLVRRALRPLRELVEQTRGLAADSLHRRLDGSAQPEELEPLIAQFNELLARLHLAYEQLEGFNADVAHELCTPLATLIGSTEIALRKARSAAELHELLGANLEDLHRMSAIVSDMLFLSRADRGAQARRLPVPSLAALARNVADYQEAVLADAGLEVVVDGEASGAFDAALLQRAILNLLSNAVRYAERGSTVQIEIRGSDDEATLSVINRGAPIDPQHLPRLFDRFYRADPSRTNAARHHGLGLAIVAAIARMHGGRTLAASTSTTVSVGLLLKKAGGAGEEAPPPRT